MRKTRLVVVGLSWAGLLVFCFLHARAIDRRNHGDEAAALIDLQAAHERLQHELLLARSDVDHADEGIVAAFAETQSALNRLERDGASDGSVVYEAFLSGYRSDIDRACEHVEYATAASAEWKRALQRIRNDVETLEKPDKRDRGSASQTNDAVMELLAEMALYQLSAEIEPSPRTAELLHQLRGDRRASALAADIDASIRAKADLEAEIALVDAAGLERRVQQLMATHESAFDDSLNESDLHRLGIYALTLVLFVWLVQSMHELRKRTHELRESNQRLEERVDERTRRLLAANATLQVEVIERQRAEQEARIALEAAEAASRTKSEFLANMSHEIRTPMTSILGFSERLLDEGLTDTDKIEAISTIRRNGDYLLQIINDILDLSKIEAGKLTIERIACSPRQIVAEVYAAMDVRAAIEGIDLVVTWKGKLPETIVTDPVRLKQVLLNLVGNAIKFTDEGSVQIAIEFDAANSKLRFEVKDSGIGIDAATQSRLFQPFTQADSSTTRQFGGTGLGLSISRHLVEKLGGAITVASELGRGTTFTFTIDTGDLTGVPLVEGKDLSFLGEIADPDVRRVAPVLHGARILLVEDGEDNRRLISYILGAAEARVDVVVNGREALDAALGAHLSSLAYDLILMDMQMPVLDGYSATRMLRERGCTSPILALTAHAMATDRQKCLDAGCDDFCTKPIVRNVFLETIARLLGRNPSEPRAPLPSHVDARDDAELAELVRLFVVELAADVTAMRIALENGDVDTLAHRAHRLKGAAGSYGFPSLTTHAAALERRARSGADKSELARDLELIIALCDAARVERGIRD